MSSRRRAILLLSWLLPLFTGCNLSGDLTFKVKADEVADAFLAVRPVVESGMEPDLCRQLQTIAKGTPVKQSAVRALTVRYQGADLPLRVEMIRDNDNMVRVYLLTKPTLGAKIQAALAERGIK